MLCPRSTAAVHPSARLPHLPAVGPEPRSQEAEKVGMGGWEAEERGDVLTKAHS